MGGDVCQLTTFLEPSFMEADIIMASKLMKPLMNPGLFLKQVYSFMRETAEWIIPFPKAFQPETFRVLVRGVACIHTNHNSWFSYHVARHLIEKVRSRMEEVYAYAYTLQRSNLLHRMTRGGLFLIAIGSTWVLSAIIFLGRRFNLHVLPGHVLRMSHVE